MLFDTHFHLDQLNEHELKQTLEDAITHDIRIISPSMSLEGFRKITRIAEESPGRVYPALGLHPEQRHNRDEMDGVLKAFQTCRASIVAVGEVGLPHYQRTCTQTDIEQLRLFMAIAKSQQLPLILHAVHETAEIALKLLQEAGVEKAVFHWHKAEPLVTRAIIEAGFFVSVTPEVIYRKRDQDMVSLVPISQLLVETDGPWPYNGPFAGKPTRPSMITEVVLWLAQHYRLPVDEVGRILNANTCRLFSITV